MHSPEEFKDVGDIDSDTEASDSSTTHSVVFKCIGATRDPKIQEVLSKALHLINNGEAVPVRITPEPENPIDARAIAFNCKLGERWERIGYIVKEAVEAVHDALNHQTILETRFDWIKYIVHWSRSGPGWMQELL